MTEDSNGTADITKISCPLNLSTTESLYPTTKVLWSFLCSVPQNETWWDAGIWNWGQNGSLSIIWQKYLRYFCSWKGYLHTGNKILHSFLTFLEQQRQNHPIMCFKRSVFLCDQALKLWSGFLYSDLELLYKGRSTNVLLTPNSFFYYDQRNEQGPVELLAMTLHMYNCVFKMCMS